MSVVALLLMKSKGRVMTHLFLFQRPFPNYWQEEKSLIEVQSKLWTKLLYLGGLIIYSIFPSATIYIAIPYSLIIPIRFSITTPA